MLLWMEDNATQTMDMAILLERWSQPVKRFPDPALMVHELAELKKANRLGAVKLLLDIMIPGAPYVISPKEWNGKKEEYYPADHGYKAGLAFYERVILKDARDFWKPLPGVVFLSVLPSDHELITSSLDAIKGKAGKLDPTLPRRIHALSKDDLTLEEKLKSYLLENNHPNETTGDVVNGEAE